MIQVSYNDFPLLTKCILYLLNISYKMQSDHVINSIFAKELHKAQRAQGKLKGIR